MSELFPLGEFVGPFISQGYLLVSTFLKMHKIASDSYSMCSIVEEKKLGNWLKLKAVTLLSDVVPGGEKLLTQRMLAADEDMNYLKTTGDVVQLL